MNKDTTIRRAEDAVNAAYNVFKQALELQEYAAVILSEYGDDMPEYEHEDLMHLIDQIGESIREEIREVLK
jgi:hypothetical protein